MCDPTGISETAVISTVAAEAAASSAAAAGTAAAAGGAAAATAAGGMSASSLIGIGGTALSTGLGIVSSLGKSAQTGYTYAQTAYNANVALANSYNTTQAKDNQEADKTATQSFDVVRAMAEAKGTATAAAGEAGVGGVSFANVLSSIESKEGFSRASNDENYTTTIQQNQDEALANQAKTKAIINSTPQPSNLGLFTDIAAQTVKGGLKIYEAANPSPTSPKTSAGDAGANAAVGSFGPEFNI